MYKSMISIGKSKALRPVIYHDSEEIPLPTAQIPHSIDYGFLIIEGTPKDLATLFAQISSAEGVLHYPCGGQAKFRSFGHNSYNVAKDPVLVLGIQLIETLAERLGGYAGL